MSKTHIERMWFNKVDCPECGAKKGFRCTNTPSSRVGFLACKARLILANNIKLQKREEEDAKAKNVNPKPADYDTRWQRP